MPYWRAKSVLKVAASDTGEGIAVVGGVIRTPAGPSVKRSGGMPSRGMPGTYPTSPLASGSAAGCPGKPGTLPRSMEIFSSRVIAPIN